jgi:hypothetical protein
MRHRIIAAVIATTALLGAGAAAAGTASASVVWNGTHYVGGTSTPGGTHYVA